MTNPTKISQPFAAQGDKNLIPNTSIDDTIATQALGFPPKTAQAIASGGSAPTREDFNGILNMLSQHAFFSQSGNLYEYDQTLDYAVNAIVVYDGKLYRCIQANTSASPKAPTNTSYWVEFPKAEATKLENARTIAISGGATGTATPFDGSANITIPVTSLDATKLTGTASINTTGNAATSSSSAKWTTARTITLAGVDSGSATIDGSANVTITTSCTGCSATCSSSCGSSCSSSCGGSCTHNCGSSCTSSCGSSCTSSCGSDCTASCKSSCSILCSGGCSGCGGNCSSGCGDSCSNNCSGRD